MVICFEEKDRAAIEVKGMTIIEFKRNLYKLKKNIEHVWANLKAIVGKVLKAWNLFRNKFIEACDSFKMTIEVARDIYHYSTSFRYKIVKKLSKCTGIEMQVLWKMTRRTWLARSCC